MITNLKVLSYNVSYFFIELIFNLNIVLTINTGNRMQRSGENKVINPISVYRALLCIFCNDSQIYMI